jgi:Ca2+-binding EF-hand superfamily protein
VQISSAYSSGSSMALQALRDLFQPQGSQTTGQSVPGESGSAAKSGRASGPPPFAMNGGGFDPATFAGLIPAQSGGFGQAMVNQTDADGNGGVSIDELSSALGVEVADLTETFGAVDADGDGSITGEEMDAGFRALAEKNGMPARPSGADMASQLLSALDGDGDEELSLSELLDSFSEDDEEDTSISDRFSELDTDGNGSLGASELSTAIEAMISRQLQAYADRYSEDGARTSIAA